MKLRCDKSVTASNQLRKESIHRKIMSQAIRNALETLNFVSYNEDPRVLKEAEEIARSTRPTARRPRAQIQQDAHFGMTVQFAVLDALQGIDGFSAMPAPENDKSYDILLIGPGFEQKLDIKGLRRGLEESNTYTVSGWELMNADPDTMYLLFNCASGEAVLTGYFMHEDLRASRKYFDAMGRPTGYIFNEYIRNPKTLAF